MQGLLTTGCAAVEAIRVDTFFLVSAASAGGGGERMRYDQ